MADDFSNSELVTLRAVVGWLELGLPDEALAELNQLEPAAQERFEALEARWMILARMQRWDDAVLVSKHLTECAPDRAVSWLDHAYATRRCTGGSLSAAFKVLSAVAGNFPNEPVIPYNLACYACQLQRGEAETLDWFERALRVGEPKALVQMALADADLEPMHSVIKKLAKKRGWGSK